MKRTNMAAAVVLSVLLASGCATKSGEKSDPEVGSNASSSEAQPAEEASDEAPEDSTLTFGETYKYEDGVSIRVGKPKPFKPSEYAAADEAPAYLSFEVNVIRSTITSGSSGVPLRLDDPLRRTVRSARVAA